MGSTFGKEQIENFVPDSQVNIEYFCYFAEWAVCFGLYVILIVLFFSQI